MDSPAQIFLLTAVLMAALGGVMLLVFSNRRLTQLNKEHYQAKWLSIEHGLDESNPATYPLTFMNADKLVDHALRERRIKGKTMGERMKSANNMWSNANYIWNAHKIRNRLAHEADATVDYDTTRRALVAYKQALKDLGAI